MSQANGSVYVPGSNFQRTKHYSLPIDQYPLNRDPNPTVITKPSPPVEQVKHINLRLLKPPPQQAGDIVVHQEPDVQLPAAPPLHIRQKTQDQIQLPPMVIRERPPPTECIPEKHITLPGKILPPPPRQVILERLPSAPPHPQEVTVERWLESEPATRRVVYKPARVNTFQNSVPKNQYNLFTSFGANLSYYYPEPIFNEPMLPLCSYSAMSVNRCFARGHIVTERDFVMGLQKLDCIIVDEDVARSAFRCCDTYRVGYLNDEELVKRAYFQLYRLYR